MLAGVVSTHSSHQDIRALGLLMIQLMEIGTSLKDPQTLELQDPGRWDENIKIFLRNTAVLEGKELRKVCHLVQLYSGWLILSERISGTVPRWPLP